MKKKVLIIENDKEIQDIVSYVIEMEGYLVEATRHDPNIKPINYHADLIILDEWINKKEGYMLCKELKAIEKLQNIPVIIFSTANDIEDIAKNCKADGFVRKPFDIDSLISEIKKFLPSKSPSKITW